MEPVLHDALPYGPWTDPVGRKLPGTRAAEAGDWLQTDEAFAAQMALRDRLIADDRARVTACLPMAVEAAHELLEAALARLKGLPGYTRTGEAVTRPDGVTVPLDRAHPMATLGRLGQPDLCILQPREGVHLLTAAVLCFPAGWTLSQKIGRAMTAIHVPVDRYDAAIAARVERMLTHLKTGQPIRRANAMASFDPSLFRPLPEGAPRPRDPDGTPPYIRSERQVLFRLPGTKAIVFSIHTFMVRRTALTPEQARALADHPVHVF